MNKEAYARAVKNHHESEGVSAWGMAADAVLRTHGQALAKQAVTEALGRVRDRIDVDGSCIWEGDSSGLSAIATAVAIIDDELTGLEASKRAPASDHVHELESCSFCDKRTTAPSKEQLEEAQAFVDGSKNEIDRGIVAAVLTALKQAENA